MKKKLLLAGVLFSAVGLNAQLSEDFEGPTAPALPTGWTTTYDASCGTPMGWTTGDDGTLGSQYFPVEAHTQFAGTNDDAGGSGCTKTNERLVSPSFNLPASSDVYFLKFEYVFDNSYGGFATVEVSTNGGTSWTTLKQLAASDVNGAGTAFVWSADSVYLDDYNGQSNIQIAFNFDDDGEWASGFMVDDVETITASPSTDLTNLDVNRTYNFYGQNSPAATFAAQFQNTGTEPISSFDLNYTIDGNTYTETVNLSPALNFNEITTIYTHGTSWTPSGTGNFNYSVFSNNVNGNGNDDNTSNDDYSGSLEVVATAVDRVALLESFSSNTCGPCATTNGNIMNPIMTTIDENEAGSNYAFVKYQQDYPAPGTDFSNNAEASARHDYYNIGGIPTQYFNGQNEPDWSWNSTPQLWTDVQANIKQQWDWEAARPARVGITATATRDGNDLDIDVTLDAAADVPASKLHVAILNTEYSDNTGSNGETDFHHVMRKMLPNNNGTNISAMTAGGQATENFTYTYTTGTPAQGDFTFWNDDIEIIVWLQNNSSDEVYNAQITTITDLLSVTEDDILSKFEMYPNPANNNVNIRFTPANGGEKTTIEIVNSLGQVVKTENLGNIGSEFTYNLDVTNFNNGLYLVNLKVGDQVVSKRLSVLK